MTTRHAHQNAQLANRFRIVTPTQHASPGRTCAMQRAKRVVRAASCGAVVQVRWILECMHLTGCALETPVSSTSPQPSRNRE